ncbi:hypothetical protein PMIN06_009764 [Paraphaeosphaeria minitans]
MLSVNHVPAGQDIMSPSKLKELSRYSACDIADALLKLGVPGAGFLPDMTPMPHTSELRKPELKKIIAPASTFLMAPKATPSFPHPVSLPKDLPKSNLSASGPYADFTQTGTVVIISQPPGQSCAVMGGIMAARMKVSGAQGIVINGRVRDLVALAETGLPIWSKGTSIVGAGAETSFHAREVPVQVGETVVEPGDIVMIDPFENGVVAVPQSKVEEVLQLLPKLVGADEKVISDVKNGRTVDEAFKKHRSA